MTARPMRPRSDLGKRFWSALSVFELDPTPPAMWARRALGRSTQFRANSGNVTDYGSRGVKIRVETRTTYPMINTDMQHWMLQEH